ncbi:unnamed protein product [Mesocestoides corti]|uniref:Uncharacterized protein n=1 Tax=Mesocestoides corti TaxID=53468 RepID=A0A0R3UK60_MESCO|nr:unnamed protein product [Mesocestoides corti]
MRLVLACLFLLFSSCFGQKVILVSLDGFRHDYIEKALAAKRNVSAFQQITNAGFRAMKVQSVMLSLTFPSHFSLATGRYVENHGLVGNTFWDNDLKDNYVYTNDTKNLEPKWFTMNGNEPLWLTNQRNGGKSCVFYWPGSNSRMNGEMMYTDFGLYSSIPSLRFRVDRIMDWITKPDINFCMLYFNQPDNAGHKYGPDSTQVLDAIEEVNDGIAYLLQRIEQSKELDEPPNIIVTSDHGMTTVNYKKVVNASEVLSADEYIFGVDGSPASLGVWPKAEGQAAIDAIYNKLKTLQNCKVYKKEEIPEEYHFKNNSRIAPIVLIPDLGWMVQSDPNDPYKSSLNGMHGYNNSEPDMHPFLVAMGPGIKQIGPIEEFHQVDVYALVCLLLKIYRPNVVDSNVYRVIPVIKNLPSIDVIEAFNAYATGARSLPDGSMTLSGNYYYYYFLNFFHHL